jgi:NTP pyrophosphatase (non-canonical NTP hydrolase)
MVNYLLRFVRTIPKEYLDTINISITKYGKDKQILCFVEELGECLSELLDNEDWGVIRKDNPLFTELADVIVATETIRVIYGLTNTSFDNCKGHSGSLQQHIAKMFIGISHYERGRINTEQFCELIWNIYFGISILNYDDAELTEELDKKFKKFDRQIKEQCV